MCAGVCIATDLALWKKKEFMLLAMINETSGKAVGFCHLFIQELDGQYYLTVPGIEPSTEFLSQVKTAEIYPMIEAALQSLGEVGGFDAVLLPTRQFILSNRQDISSLVDKRAYPKKILPIEVDWNTLPRPYPFNEVHVLWTRPKPKWPPSHPVPIPMSPEVGLIGSPPSTLPPQPGSGQMVATRPADSSMAEGTAGAVKSISKSQPSL